MSNQLANAIRALAMDAVQKAGSGHPGMPMGMADIAEVLFRKFLKHNPHNPYWPNRDRFVVSNGHGSMLLYAVLYLTGYNLPLEELKRFRQLHSQTPGHPEVHETSGVETTTGPLGQGLGNAVGMAIAEKHLSACFNRPQHVIVDHHTFVFLGDGCLMEGISHEVCSLAGTLKLNKLIAFWDDNGISIDGPVNGWFTEDVPKRFESYGWQVVRHVDGHASAEIETALKQALLSQERPTLICCRTTIGFGSPQKAGKASVHGSPLGADEIQRVREQLHWPYPPFEIPDEILKAWNGVARGQIAEAGWQSTWDSYAKAYPDLASELKRRWNKQLPAEYDDFFKHLMQLHQKKSETMATRQASLVVLEAAKTLLPELFAGSADLTSSNLTRVSDAINFTHKTPEGRYLHYGVREFGMTAVMNGMALYGGVVPLGGTFLVFSDYARNGIRMAAIMKQRVIFVLTHDSIGLGEDGPTHQPIEHLASLRLIPNIHVWRPCDVVETIAAWQSAIYHQHGPTVLALSRQNCTPQMRTESMMMEISRGGYQLKKVSRPDLVFIATGSEVGIAMQAAVNLEEAGYSIGVVSMPCVELFNAQDIAYQREVIPPQIPLIVIEAGVPDTWYRFVQDRGIIMGLTHFGASAPAPVLFEYYGLTVDRAVTCAHSLLQSY